MEKKIVQMIESATKKFEDFVDEMGRLPAEGWVLIFIVSILALDFFTYVFWDPVRAFVQLGAVIVLTLIIYWWGSKYSRDEHRGPWK